MLPTLLLATLALVADAPWPLTRAERTDYRETSTLADVQTFLAELKARGAPIEQKTIGQSAGGKPIILAIASTPNITTAKEARAAGKVVVYVQANIHGGEVEGKEAAQMLLRAVARNDAGAAKLLDRLVLLVVPVYNVDGNEAFGDGATLRTSQDGPARVGQRPNAAKLDLNRDAIKAVAPETRAVLEHIYNAWSPDVMMDLHTTNGTRHGYTLTYAPPLHPSTDPEIFLYSRDELLPRVRKHLEAEKGYKLSDYGNVENRRSGRGWYTFGDEGRYVTNYAGLRNRIGILSEAASFFPFKTRVEVTDAFVRAILDDVAANADAIKAMIARADSRTPRPALAIRTEQQSRGINPIPLEVRTSKPIDHHKAPTAFETVPLPVFDRFRAVATTPPATHYLVPASQTEILALLRRHGIATETLDSPWTGKVDVFQIRDQTIINQPFQGGKFVRLDGSFQAQERTAPAGTVRISTSQPLGLLAAYLLEPECLDGAAAWGFLGESIRSGVDYPILKVRDGAR